MLGTFLQKAVDNEVGNVFDVYSESRKTRKSHTKLYMYIHIYIMRIRKINIIYTNPAT